MTDTITKGAGPASAQGAANQSGAHINKDAYKEAKDFLPLNGVDHVEFWVGNAKQAAHYFRALWGFTPIAYAGLETGVRDRISYVMRQNDITIVVTGALSPEGEIAEHVHRHGDGVKDIAFSVDDASARRGARRRAAARRPRSSRSSSTAARTASCAVARSARTARSATRSSTGATITASSRPATERSRSRPARRRGCSSSRSTTASATSISAT